MDQQTSRLWKRPLNPIERLVDPLKDILLNIEQMYGLLAKSYRIPGYFLEKTYLQHKLWHNQLLWIDLRKRLTRYLYAKDKLGPLATAEDLIDMIHGIIHPPLGRPTLIIFLKTLWVIGKLMGWRLGISRIICLTLLLLVGC